MRSLKMNVSGEENRIIKRQAGLLDFSPIEDVLLIEIARQNNMTVPDVIKTLTCDRLHDITRLIWRERREVLYKLFSKASQKRSDNKKLERKRERLENEASRFFSNNKAKNNWVKKKALVS